MSTHLKGIATKLKKIQQNLLKTLRKELKRITKELDWSSGSTGVGWAVAQKEKRVSFSGTLQKLQEQVIELEKRTKALTSWEVLNNRLRSIDALCTKGSKTAPALKQVLSQLVTEFKKRFATELWDPLFASGEFSKGLEIVESEVQALLYNYTQTFNWELTEIKNQFNSLLPSTSPPMFDVSVEGNQQSNSIHESFQRLYQWIFEGFRTVISECQEFKKSGAQWHDPDNERRSWKKLETEVEAALRKSQNTLSFEVVQRIGSKVLLMQRGFTEVLFGIFDNPDKPPDFEELKRLFKEEKIQIQVSRKT